MTKKGNIPIKLWFDSPEEMRIMSNKAENLVDLFKVLDIFNFSRIDTLELFSVILISLEGKIEVILNNIMGIFGFSDPNLFMLEEFHFFLDCLFRGLMKLLISKKDKKPSFSGKKIFSNEIEQLA